MRRIKTGLVLATALVMGLSLFGCGSKKTEENVTTTEAKAEVDDIWISDLSKYFQSATLKLLTFLIKRLKILV